MLKNIKDKMESQVSCFEDSFMDKFELDDNFFESKSIYSITKKPGKWTQEEVTI